MCDYSPHSGTDAHLMNVYKKELFPNEFLACGKGKKCFLWLLVLKDFCLFLYFCHLDQRSSNPIAGLFNHSTSYSSPPATSATGSIFGSSTCLSRAPGAASVYGQGSTVSSSALGNSAGSTTCQSLVFSKDSKPVTTSSKGTAVMLSVPGPGACSSNTAQPGVNFGATTTPRAAGTFIQGETCTCMLYLDCL